MLPLYPNSNISKELGETWRDSLAKGKNEQFLIRLSKVMSPPSLVPKQNLSEKILIKYPNGELAFDNATNLDIPEALTSTFRALLSTDLC